MNQEKADDVNKKTIEQLMTEFLHFAAGNWREPLHRHVVDAWREELAEAPLALLERALKRARRLKFPPNLGDIFAILDDLAESDATSQSTSTRALLDRGDKPPDWEPLDPGESEALYRKFRSACDETAAKKQMPAAASKLDAEANLRKLRQQAEELLRRESDKKNDL